MPRRPTRSRPALLTGALLFASLLSCGREITGLDANGRRAGAIALDPRFATVRLGGTGEVMSIGSVVDFASVRVVLEREDGEVEVDTVVPFPPSVTEVSLRLTVTLDAQAPPSGEPMSVTMKYVNATGDTVFSGGPITVVAKPGSSGSPQPTPVPIDYVGVGADAKTLTISPDSFVGLRLATTSFAATVLDSSDTPLPLAPVAFTSTDSQRVHVNLRTGATSLLGARGTAKIIAQTLTGQADTADVSITPVATSVVLLSGGGQQVLQALPFPQPVRVRATAVDNFGVAGVEIEFSVTAGAGTVSQVRDTTDANGDAEVIWTAGDVAGPAILRASIFGTATGINIGGTQLSDAANNLTFGAQPTNITAGNALPGFTVVVRDVLADTVSSYNSSVALTLTGGTAGASLIGTTTTNALNGVAVFSGLTVDRAGTGYRIVASLPSIPTVPVAQTNMFNVAAAPPATVTIFSGGGQSAPPATALTDSIRVRVRDVFSQPVAGVTVTFAVTIGGGSVSPLTAITDAAGLAGTRWTVGTAGPQQITASVVGLTSAVASATAVAPGGAPVLFLGVDSVAVAIGRNRQVPVFLTNPAVGTLPITLTMRDPAVASWSAGSVNIFNGGNQALPFINGLLEGSTWAVASSSAGTDSVFVVVDSSVALIDGNTTQYVLVGDTLRTLVLIPEPAGVGGLTLTVTSTDPGSVLVAPGTGLGFSEPVCNSCPDLRAAGGPTGALLAPPSGTAVVTIPEGRMSAHLVVLPIAANGPVALTLEATGVSGSGTVIYPQPNELNFSAYYPQIALDHESELTIYRSYPGRHDVTVRLRSLDDEVVRVDSISIIPRNDYYGSTVRFRGMMVGTTSLIAEVDGVEDTIAVEVLPGRIAVSLDGGGLLAAGTRDNLTAYIGADAGGFFTYAGERRQPVTVTVTSRSPGVVRPVFNSLRIPHDESDGSLLIDAVGPGAAWVVVEAPGYAADSGLITVEDPTIVINDSDARTGVGLVHDFFRIDRSQYGIGMAALPITIEARDPSILRVLTPAITIPASTPYAYARLQGVAEGTTWVVVSGPGIAADSVSYQVFPPALAMSSYLSNFVWNPDSIARSVSAAVMGGGYQRTTWDTLAVKIRSTNPSVILVTDSVLNILPGQGSRTGGVIRMVAPGTAQIVVEAPGLAPDTSAIQTVVGRLLSLSTTSTTVGRGLQSTNVTVSRNTTTAVTLPFTVTVQGPLGTSVAVPSDAFPPSTATRNLVVRSGSVIGGTDTLIVTAAGHAPDTTFVFVGNTRAQLFNVTTSMEIGQSYDFVSVRLRNVSPLQTQASRDTSKVRIESRDPTVVSVAPDTLRINPGELSNVAYGSMVGVSPGSTWIVATPPNGGLEDSVRVTVRAPRLQLADYGVLVLSMQEETDPFDYWVQRQFPDSTPLWVHLSSSDPSVVSVPDSVLIAADDYISYFAITSGDTTGSALITASAGGVASAAQRVFVTRARFEAYVYTSIVGDTGTIEIYRQNANYYSAPSRVPIPLRFAFADTTIARTVHDTLTFPAGESYVYMDSLLSLAAGSNAVTISDDRIGQFVRVSPVTSTFTVDAPSLRLETSTAEIHATVGTSTSNSQYFYHDGVIDSLWVRLISVGGRFAPTSDSVLVNDYSYGYFGVRGISAGIDTLVISAPGYEPDSLIVRVGAGYLEPVTIIPATVVQGDSVQVRLRLYTAAQETAYVAGSPMTFLLGSSGPVSPTLGAGAITEVVVTPGNAEVIFYVKALGPGTGNVTVTHPSFAPFEIRFTTRSP